MVAVKQATSHDAAAVSGGVRASDPDSGGLPVTFALAGRGMASIQRGRVVGAMVSVAARQGITKATVTNVVAFSGVSRRTFYELFDDREQCFLAAFDECAERAAHTVQEAYESPGESYVSPDEWSMRVRAALVALLGFLQREPDLARVLVVEALGAGPRALERRRRLLEQLAAVLDRDGCEAAGGNPPPLAADGAVGGVLSVIHAYMTGSKSGTTSSKSGTTRLYGADLVELLNPLVSMIVLPYLGSAAAQMELQRPALHTSARENANGAEAEANPLRGLNMRLTYRTVRVLMALAAHPGASNRQLADSASIRDQGQISKLLARLRHLGLIANNADERARGEANAWTLTPTGHQVWQTLTQHGHV